MGSCKTVGKIKITEMMEMVHHSSVLFPEVLIFMASIGSSKGFAVDVGPEIGVKRASRRAVKTLSVRATNER